MKIKQNHSFHPSVSEQWQIDRVLLLSVLFILDFATLMSEWCLVLTALLCCHKDSLWCEPLLQSWGSATESPGVVSPPSSSRHCSSNCCLLNYLGYWEGSLCHSSSAPDLRAPKINPSPLPLGFPSVHWLVKNKGFTMAFSCICFNTRRCFLLTWTLVCHSHKQMAFR